MLVQRLCAAVVLLLGGCGAVTARLGIAPTLAVNGGRARAGVEASFALGFGTPLDFRGASRHYLQALATAGGGLDARTGGRVVIARADLGYLHLPTPSLMLRTGLGFVYHNVQGDPDGLALYGVGAHLGLLPVVLSPPPGVILKRLSVGPELRADYLWSSAAGATHGQLALPLVAEFDLLVAGD